MRINRVAVGVGNALDTVTGSVDGQTWYDALTSGVPSSQVDQASAQNGGDLIASISQLLQTGLLTYTQIQFLNANLERAKAGLPPLNASDYSPSVNVGLDPKIRDLLIYGGVAFIGVYLFTTLKKGR